jgi:eukaryotic-like serine/threonine-protein kinase
MKTCPKCKVLYADSEEICAEDGTKLVRQKGDLSGAPPLPPGAQVGEYVVEELLGEGGFGSVYRASHPVIGKTVAIKILHAHYSANPQIVARFVAEARAVNRIRHPNIVDIFGFGQIDDGRRYYVMELLEGIPLDRYLRTSGPVPPEVAIPLMLGLAQALDAAHAAGIAHRDLKPENVFIAVRDRGRAAVKLLDFGIAKLLTDSAPGDVKTRTGTPLGTPQFMSPEQCRGKVVNHRTDIYSLGILIHRVLTGSLPFDSEDPLELLNLQASALSPSMSSVHPSLPPALDEPVFQMLQKDPEDRPESVLAAVDALAEAARRSGIAVPEESADVPLSAIGWTRPESLEPGVRIGHGESADAATLPAPDGSPRGRSSGLKSPHMTPGERAARSSLGASHSPVAPAKGPRWLGAAAVVVALGLGVVLAVRGRGSPQPERFTGAQSSALATATSPAIATAIAIAPPASPSSSASLSATPPPAADVTLTVSSGPPGTKVLLGETVLGTVPGEVRLPRGTAPLTLRFIAKGYAPQDMAVLPDRDSTISIALRPISSGVRPPKDLEPF